MTRLILALSLVLAAAPAFAQPDDWTYRDRSAERRERREAAREARAERWEQRRERWREWSRGHRDGVHLRLLRGYHLAADATATEPIVVLGGSATIDGHAQDDVVVMGGTLRLGPTAVVDGNVFTFGGEATIDPGAQIRGKIDQAVVALPDFDVDFGWTRMFGGWWPIAAFGATVFRLGLVFVVSMLLVVVAPNWIRAMAFRASSALSSGMLGAFAEIVFVPALIAIVIGLFISVVGIPLLGAIPFLLAIGALAWTAGFAAVSVGVGARLRRQSPGESSSLVLDLLIGFLAITSLTLIAHFISLAPGWTTPIAWMTRAAGIAIEWVAWTIGLGALLSGLFVRGRVMPPPVPAQSAF